MDGRLSLILVICTFQTPPALVDAGLHISRSELVNSFVFCSIQMGMFWGRRIISENAGGPFTLFYIRQMLSTRFGTNNGINYGSIPSIIFADYYG